MCCSILLPHIISIYLHGQLKMLSQCVDYRSTPHKSNDITLLKSTKSYQITHKVSLKYFGSVYPFSFISSNRVVFAVELGLQMEILEGDSDDLSSDAHDSPDTLRVVWVLVRIVGTHKFTRYTCTAEEIIFFYKISDFLTVSPSVHLSHLCWMALDRVMSFSNEVGDVVSLILIISFYSTKTWCIFEHENIVNLNYSIFLKISSYTKSNCCILLGLTLDQCVSSFVVSKRSWRKIKLGTEAPFSDFCHNRTPCFKINVHI